MRRDWYIHYEGLARPVPALWHPTAEAAVCGRMVVVLGSLRRHLRLFEVESWLKSVMRLCARRGGMKNSL